MGPPGRIGKRQDQVGVLLYSRDGLSRCGDCRSHVDNPMYCKTIGSFEIVDNVARLPASKGLHS